MRNVGLIALFLLGLLLLLPVSAQDSPEEVKKLKIQLIETRLELFDRKLQDMERKAEEQSVQMEAWDHYFQDQRDQLQALIRQAYRKPSVADTILLQPYRSCLHFDPYRLFEGTLLIGYERAVHPALSLEAALMGTYMTRNGGLGRNYLANQELDYYNPLSGVYDDFSGDIIRGWGAVARIRKYLSQGLGQEHQAPLGFYAGAHLMYRRLTISGIVRQWQDPVFVEHERNRNLNVMAAGITLGGKFLLLNVFSLDLYLGGTLRLAAYPDEDGFTRYKPWNNIDYSGVLPTAGINIGIVQ